MNFDKRLPRVHITYDVNTDGDRKKEIPFTLGIIANLHGAKNAIDYSNRGFFSINCDNFNSVFARIKPTLNTNIIYDDANIPVQLTMQSLKCFEPEHIIKNIDFFESIIKNRTLIADLMLKLDLDSKLKEDLESYLKNLQMSISGEGYNSTAISAFFDQLKKNMDLIGEARGDIKIIAKSLIKRLNDYMSSAIDQIVHKPEFQRLEATWRNLYRLVSLSGHKKISIEIFSCSIEEIQSEMHRGFEETKIFQELYENRYGTIGGNPFACIVLDSYFGKTAEDISLLRFMSQICQASHAPLITAASPELFGLESFDSIQQLKDLKFLFSGSEWMSWAQFRREDSARYINMVIPRILTREPYKIGAMRADLFAYEEKIMKVSDLCWGNAAYCLAEKIVYSFVKYGWAASIRGVEGGGIVENLPYHNFESLYGEYRSVENYITDRQEYEFSNIGFISLCQRRGSRSAIFFSGQSIYEPAEGSQNDSLSSRISYTLNASRFAHYIKIIMRDKIGSFQSAEQLQNHLQNWLGDYVLLSDEPANDEIRARFPLREGRIWVKNMDIPGEYDVKIELRPHFQMEAARVSLSFVAKLGQK